MKLTRADFKDALEDSWNYYKFQVRCAKVERKSLGRVTDCTMNAAVLEGARITALKYYLKHTGDAK